MSATTSFSTPLRNLRLRMSEAWRIAPHLGGTDWARKHFVLSSEYAGASAAGKFRPVPYQVEILDSFIDPLVPEVVVLKSSRVGYTVLLQAAIAYWTAQQPMRQLMIQPTDQDAKDFSKENIGPMLRDCIALHGLVKEAAKRDNTNTLLKKQYPGGILTVAGAAAARNFRRLGVDKVLLDEVDGYPIGTEGDQIKLAETRATDSPFKKLILGSTPTEEDLSRIEPRYNLSDMRVFYVPCPFCGAFQTIEWERIRWPAGKPEQATLECEHCSAAIEEHKKVGMLRDGYWKPRRPEITNRRGYFIWSGYSTLPQARWANLAQDFLDSKDRPDELQVFWNTKLGRSWKHYQTRVEATDLASRAEVYGAEVPAGALVLTAGVDVQGDRLEVEVVGWGPGEESWNVDYRVFWGDPNMTPVWQQLDELLFRHQYRHASGAPMGILVTCIDSGGHHTEVVYEYADRRRGHRVWACKGMDGSGRPYIQMPGQDRKAVQRAKKKARKEGLKHKYMPVIVGTDGAKTLLFSRFAIERPGPGYCHFPVERDDEYYRQMTAERLRVVYKAGKAKKQWMPIRERNEVLDCRVLAGAAIKILNPLWSSLQTAAPVSAAPRPGRRVRSGGIRR